MKRCKAITTKGTRCKIQIESEIEFCHFHDGHVHEEKEEVKSVETSEAKPESVAEKKEPQREESSHPAENYLIPSILIGILVVFLIVFGLSFLKVF